MRQLFGSEILTRGVYSLFRVVEETGYSVTHLRRAQRALGQKWRRTKVRGVYLISEGQRQELTDWLVKDYWSKKLELYGCCWCGSRQRPHKGVGLCPPCYYHAVSLSRSWGIPARCGGKLEVVQHLIEAGALVEDEGALERCKTKLKKGVMPAFDDLSIVARLVEKYPWS